MKDCKKDIKQNVNSSSFQAFTNKNMLETYRELILPSLLDTHYAELRATRSDNYLKL